MMIDKNSISLAYATITVELSKAYHDYANDQGELRQEANLKRIEELKKAQQELEALLHIF